MEAALLLCARMIALALLASRATSPWPDVEMAK
jgi:hypothetical protein